MKFIRCQLATTIVAISCFSNQIMAHGTMESPVSRDYQCYQEGPESPVSAACIAAKSIGGIQALYDWNAISQNAGGNDQAFVPDGKLCSGGNEKYKGLDLPRTDWVKTGLEQASMVDFVFLGTAPHSTKRWSYYISKDGYDATKALTWADLEPLCTFGSIPLENGRYHMSCELPESKRGDHVIYNIWERDDSAETFYTCMDVRIGDKDETAVIDSNDDSGNSDAADYPMWEPEKTFVGGERAVFEGSVYEAKWWTHNDIPTASGPWGVWALIDEESVTDTSALLPDSPSIFNVVRIRQGVSTTLDLSHSMQMANINDQIQIHWQAPTTSTAKNWRLTRNGMTIGAGEISGNNGIVEVVISEIGHFAFKVGLCNENGCTESVAISVHVDSEANSGVVPDTTDSDEGESNHIDSAPAFNAINAYQVGDLVSNGGELFRCVVANWCSMNSVDNSAWAYEPGVGIFWRQAWESVEGDTTSDDSHNNDDNNTVEGAYAEWVLGQVYTDGDRVVYQGAIYEAKWWTNQDKPSESGPWGVWALMDSPAGSADEVDTENEPASGTGSTTDTGSSPEDLDPNQSSIDNATPDDSTGIAQGEVVDVIEPVDGMYEDFNKTFTQTSGKVIASYFVEWGVYGRNYHVNNIPAGNLTHILYAFLAVCGDNPQATPGAAAAIKKECASKQDNEVTIIDRFATLEKTYPGDTWYDDVDGENFNGNFGQLKKLKAQYPHLKMLPSVGGWTLSTPFYEMAKSPEKRKIFVDSVVDFIRLYDFFDGIDIDWEYPVLAGADVGYGSEQDSAAYTALMRDMRTAFDMLSQETGRRYEITSAIGAGSDRINAVDYKSAAQYMDYIFMMTYDFSGSWENITGHHTPLLAHEEFHEGNNTQAAALGLLAQGVPAEKIVLGAGFYGRGWAGVSNTNSHAVNLYPLYGQATGPGRGTWEAGVYDYKDLYSHYIGANNTGINGFTVYYDSNAQAPFLWNATSREFITYDSPRSIKAKADFVNEHGLGGLMSWEIDADNGLLLNAINEGLGNTEIQ